MSSRIALIALICVGATGFAGAQTPSSQDNPPSPKEAPTTPSNSSTPSSASSPHQRQAMNKEPSAQQMKECVAKHRSENSSMTVTDAKKACRDELRAPTSH